MRSLTLLNGGLIMKKIIALILCLLTICTIFPIAFAKKEPISLIAHKGYSAVAPENTLAAVKEAGKANFCGCEFDIRPTADHEWIVMHNSSVDQMTDGTGKISELTLSEIKSFTIDSGNGIDKYNKEKIPTLVEMLDECKKYNLYPVIEIKSGNEEEIAGLCEILNKRKENNKFTVISYDTAHLKNVKKLLPNMKCLVIFDNIPGWAIQFCKDNNLDGIDFEYKESNKNNVKKAREENLQLAAFTIDTSEALVDLYNMDIYFLTTNIFSPDKAHEVIPDASFTNLKKESCKHICHKSGFMGFIWNIQNFFNKLFKTNKTCSCGVVHY